MQLCNTAHGEGQQTSIPILSNFLQQLAFGEQMDQQWDIALAKPVTHSCQIFMGEEIF